MAEGDRKSPDADKKPEVPALGKTDSQVMNALDLRGHLLNDRKNKPKFTFPKTLEEFGYKFNEKGQLRSIETDQPFDFKVKDDHHYNQKRYEALGEIISQYVYQLLQEEAKLEKVMLPVDAKEDDPQSFFFMSEGAMENTEKLLVLIHGSGVVRAGQWARRLIINDCLDSGTQLPFIKRGIGQGYGVMVLNTNRNTVTRENGEQVPIKDNDSPEDHASYVWDHFISKSKAKKIAIVAHSYGGVVTTELAKEHMEAFEEKVFAIAFTDSVHSLLMQDAPGKLISFYKQRALNWISHPDPLDTPVRSDNQDCPKVSAGHPKHEWTSWSAFESIFKFLGDRYLKESGASEDTEGSSIPADAKDEAKENKSGETAEGQQSEKQPDVEKTEEKESMDAESKEPDPERVQEVKSSEGESNKMETSDKEEL